MPRPLRAPIPVLCLLLAAGSGCGYAASWTEIAYFPQWNILGQPVQAMIDVSNGSNPGNFNNLTGYAQWYTAPQWQFQSPWLGYHLYRPGDLSEPGFVSPADCLGGISEFFDQTQANPTVSYSAGTRVAGPATGLIGTKPIALSFEVYVSPANTAISQTYDWRTDDIVNASGALVAPGVVLRLNVTPGTVPQITASVQNTNALSSTAVAATPGWYLVCAGIGTRNAGGWANTEVWIQPYNRATATYDATRLGDQTGLTSWAGGVIAGLTVRETYSAGTGGLGASCRFMTRNLRISTPNP